MFPAVQEGYFVPAYSRHAYHLGDGHGFDASGGVPVFGNARVDSQRHALVLIFHDSKNPTQIVGRFYPDEYMFVDAAGTPHVVPKTRLTAEIKARTGDYSLVNGSDGWLLYDEWGRLCPKSSDGSVRMHYKHPFQIQSNYALPYQVTHNPFLPLTAIAPPQYMLEDPDIYPNVHKVRGC